MQQSEASVKTKLDLVKTKSASVKTKLDLVKTKTKAGKKPEHIEAIGRRKTASAKVRLFLKPGPILVNNKPIEQYFPQETQKRMYLTPFRITDTLEKYSAQIKVFGSGGSGQLGAVIHGLARALSLANREQFRPPLKKAGLLTRDSRMKERRKFGLAHKARARKQSPKR